MAHPLDRCVWSALQSRQRAFAVVRGKAAAFERSVAMFVAGADRSREALADMAALIPPGGQAGMVEREDWPLPPGTKLVKAATLMQMVAEPLRCAEPALPFLELGEADAPDMLALATLCRPGPFFEATHRLGGFIGVRDGAGRLIAMAGERMKAGPFTEVSAVCTHPDARGRGLARALMSVVARRIAARGETPFLHTYPNNDGAIALYASLGFRPRADVTYTIAELVPD
jgi:predicted GNAT family acetyltransferase